MEVEFVLVHNLEGAAVTLFGSGVFCLHVALQVLLELPARVADAAGRFLDGLGLSVQCSTVQFRISICVLVF